MPRKSRNESHLNFYHVMVQGINKEFIFKDDNHISIYKNIISKYLKDSNITVLAYCIMNNHAHFLFHCEKIQDLSKFMQKSNLSYSHFYNKLNNRIGFVFRDRYRSQAILNKKQLYTCLHYIHNNPVKAKIVNHMSSYKYSSYNEFFQKKELLTSRSIKLLFGEIKNYYQIFESIHRSSITDTFIDIKDTNITDYIHEFEITENVQIKDIHKDSKLIKKFIRQARSETEVTIKNLSEILNISKSEVGRIIKKIS